MNSKILTSFLIFTLILVFPQVNAQTESLKEVNQKSVKITIDHNGNVSVIHHLRDSSEARQLNFINGTISNLKFVNEIGVEESIDVFKDMKSIAILSNQGEMFVKYDLSDALVLIDNVWTLDFAYPQSTTFILPEESDLIYVNENPVVLHEKRGFVCHGCVMVLEYSINEPKVFENVKWEDNEFVVEIRNNSDIDRFVFDQPTKSITFDVSKDNAFVNTIIPLELLWEPYTIFLDDEKIDFDEIMNNGTHVWLSMRPDSSGEITIIGTTVVPEFPIIAPLAIGFLIILVLPLVRKFNLR